MRSLSSKNILLISPESWSHIFVSKHHYAIELARRGHRVYFLNPPDPAHYKQLTMTDSGIERLYIVNYPGQLKGMRFFPAIFRRLLNRKFLQQFEVLAGCRVDVVWNFENSRFFDLGFAGGRLKIYHQVDLNQDFHVKEAAASADICFCTTDFIRAKILPYNKKVFKIHHGVSLAAFNDDHTSASNGRPVATLVGNLDIPYLDQELLQKLVTENPGVQFNFVGGYDQQGAMFKLFSKHLNVKFTGRVDSSAIKDHLVHSDVLLVCYKANEYREQLASPHKMMEYFASGKVIVATYTDEYKDKRHLLAMANSIMEYVVKFGEIVKNLSIYNSPEKQAEKIAFAREHTYSSQLEKINDFLQESKLPPV